MRKKDLTKTQLVVFAVLLIVLGTIVVLVQRRQNVQSKASAGIQEMIDVSSDGNVEYDGNVYKTNSDTIYVNLR